MQRYEKTIMSNYSHRKNYHIRQNNVISSFIMGYLPKIICKLHTFLAFCKLIHWAT